MSWSVIWTRPALEDMRRLDRKTAERMSNAVVRLAETGHGDVKQLHGYENEWRLRVGSWRVRFRFNYGTRTIEVLRVRPRGSAYQK